MLERLALIYQVIIASEPLLSEAAAYLDESNPWEAELKRFYLKHLEDEKGHAQWQREDLGDHPINLHFGAAQLAGMAYYLIRHVHPVALLGYMQALERTAIPLDVVEELEAEYGKQAMRTLRLHAEEDPKHDQEIQAAASHVPPEWTPLVENTRIQTLALVKGL